MDFKPKQILIQLINDLPQFSIVIKSLKLTTGMSAWIFCYHQWRTIPVRLNIRERPDITQSNAPYKSSGNLPYKLHYMIT